MSRLYNLNTYSILKRNVDFCNVMERGELYLIKLDENDDEDLYSTKEFIDITIIL